MPIAYVLDGPDNDSHMCGSTEVLDDIPGLPVCPTCGYKTDFEFSNRSFVTKRRVYDVSGTYDGALIVSLKFKEHCIRMHYEGLRFLSFDNDKDFFQLLVSPAVEFDAQRRKTRFENLCGTCGHYESVVGAHPCYLKGSPPISKGFYRTDLMFASGNEKHPLIVVGIKTKQELERERFRGVTFEAIEP